MLKVCHTQFEYFLYVPASAADIVAVNPNDIKMPLANELKTFLIKGKPIFSNGPKRLPRNPPDCTILDS